MKYFELKEKLKLKEVAAVYLFSGPEDYLIREIIQKLKEIIFTPETLDFNFDLFYASESSSSEILSCARTFPFMSEKRLIITKRIEKFNLDELKNLAQYVKNPVLTTCLVLIAEERNFFLKYFDQRHPQVEQVHFWRLFDSQIPLWIIEKVKEKGKQISFNSANYLYQETGSSLENLTNEIEKLILFTSQRREITLKDVSEVIGYTKTSRLSDLLVELGKKNRTKALKSLNNLFEEGCPPVLIQGSILKYLRRFIVNPEELRKEKIYFTQTRLQEALRKILKADFELKTGQKTPRLILELLILDLSK